MKYLRNSRLLAPVLLLALLAVSPIAANAQSKSDVEEAKTAADRALEALEEADAALADGIEELERIQGELYSLNYRIEKLAQALTEYGDNVVDLEQRARDLVRNAYINGNSNAVTTAFSAGNIQELITSQTLFDRAATLDLAQLDQLDVVRRQMDRLTDELNVKESEVTVLEGQQAEVVEHLAELQAKADEVHADAQANYRSVYAEYKARLAREAAARAAQQSGAAAGIPSATKGVVCPVAGSNYFIDTWGYPRSGGRTHKGTDIMAAYNTPLVAMNSGTVRLNTHSLGGRQTYVYGDDGVTYYYAHLSQWPSGLSNGQRVAKGQVIGYVGTSGNTTVAHLHLGMIAGGIYVNPYPTVRPVC